MAFLEVIGELFGFSDAKGWALVGEDPGFSTEFRGEYISENMTESIGSTLGETTTINKALPDQQWLHGESEPFTFTSRLFASNSFQNIKQQIELLKSFARRNKDLKRAPIFLFTAGTEIGFTCFVRGARFRYDELRSDGSLRGAVVDITLQKIEEIVTEAAATSLASQIKFAAGIVSAAPGIASSVGRLLDIPGGSLHTIGQTVTVVDGDTYESIAEKQYGDALLGDILRRTKPDKATLSPNDNVDLVDAVEIASIPVTQQSVSMKNTPENLALREEFLELRERSTTIFV